MGTSIKIPHRSVRQLAVNWPDWIIIDQRKLHAISNVRGVYSNPPHGYSIDAGDMSRTVSTDAKCYPVKWVDEMPENVTWQTAYMAEFPMLNRRVSI